MFHTNQQTSVDYFQNIGGENVVSIFNGEGLHSPPDCYRMAHAKPPVPLMVIYRFTAPNVLVAAERSQIPFESLRSFFPPEFLAGLSGLKNKLVKVCYAIQSQDIYQKSVANLRMMFEGGNPGLGEQMLCLRPHLEMFRDHFGSRDAVSAPNVSMCMYCPETAEKNVKVIT